MDHLCYLCLVFVMLSRLFIAALSAPEVKRRTSWLLFVMFIVILVTFPFGILGQAWNLIAGLIVSISDPCCLNYFHCVKIDELFHQSKTVYKLFLAYRLTTL